MLFPQKKALAFEPTPFFNFPYQFVPRAMSAATTATASSDPSRNARNTQAGSSGPFEFFSIARYTLSR